MVCKLCSDCTHYLHPFHELCKQSGVFWSLMEAATTVSVCHSSKCSQFTLTAFILWLYVRVIVLIDGAGKATLELSTDAFCGARQALVRLVVGHTGGEVVALPDAATGSITLAQRSAIVGSSAAAAAPSAAGRSNRGSRQVSLLTPQLITSWVRNAIAQCRDVQIPRRVPRARSSSSSSSTSSTSSSTASKTTSRKSVSRPLKRRKKAPPLEAEAQRTCRAVVSSCFAKALGVAVLQPAADLGGAPALPSVPSLSSTRRSLFDGAIACLRESEEWSFLQDDLVEGDGILGRMFSAADALSLPLRSVHDWLVQRCNENSSIADQWRPLLAFLIARHEPHSEGLPPSQSECNTGWPAVWCELSSDEAAVSILQTAIASAVMLVRLQLNQSIEERRRCQSGNRPPPASTLPVPAVSNVRPAGESNACPLMVHVAPWLVAEPPPTPTRLGDVKFEDPIDTTTANAGSGVSIAEELNKERSATLQNARQDVMRIAELWKKAGHAATSLAQVASGAVQRISESYSSSESILKELLQNADDCDFSNVPTPTVWIGATEDALLFGHNEAIGFTVRDAESLCAVGQSKKLASSSSTCGYKGVGWKSVFCISDTPEIHSAEFHMQFNSSSQPVAYIIPSFLDDCCAEFAADNASSSPRSRITCKALCALSSLFDAPDPISTVIVLPWKSKAARSVILEALASFEASSMLFMRRIQRIFIGDSSLPPSFRQRSFSRNRSIAGSVKAQAALSAVACDADQFSACVALCGDFPCTFGSIVIVSRRESEISEDTWFYCSVDIHAGSACVPHGSSSEIPAASLPKVVNLIIAVCLNASRNPMYYTILPIEANPLGLFVHGPFLLNTPRNRINLIDSFNHFLLTKALPCAISVAVAVAPRLYTSALRPSNKYPEFLQALRPLLRHQRSIMVLSPVERDDDCPHFSSPNSVLSVPSFQSPLVNATRLLAPSVLHALFGQYLCLEGAPGCNDSNYLIDTPSMAYPRAALQYFEIPSCDDRAVLFRCVKSIVTACCFSQAFADIMFALEAIHLVKLRQKDYANTITRFGLPVLYNEVPRAGSFAHDLYASGTSSKANAFPTVTYIDRDFGQIFVVDLDAGSCISPFSQCPGFAALFHEFCLDKAGKNAHVVPFGRFEPSTWSAQPVLVDHDAEDVSSQQFVIQRLPLANEQSIDIVPLVRSLGMQPRGHHDYIVHRIRRLEVAWKKLKEKSSMSVTGSLFICESCAMSPFPDRQKCPHADCSGCYDSAAVLWEAISLELLLSTYETGAKQCITIACWRQVLLPSSSQTSPTLSCPCEDGSRCPLETIPRAELPVILSVRPIGVNGDPFQSYWILSSPNANSNESTYVLSVPYQLFAPVSELFSGAEHDEIPFASWKLGDSRVYIGIPCCLRLSQSFTPLPAGLAALQYPAKCSTSSDWLPEAAYFLKFADMLPKINRGFSCLAHAMRFLCVVLGEALALDPVLRCTCSCPSSSACKHCLACKCLRLSFSFQTIVATLIREFSSHADPSVVRGMFFAWFSKLPFLAITPPFSLCTTLTSSSCLAEISFDQRLAYTIFMSPCTAFALRRDFYANRNRVVPYPLCRRHASPTTDIGPQSEGWDGFLSNSSLSPHLPIALLAESSWDTISTLGCKSSDSVLVVLKGLVQGHGLLGDLPANDDRFRSYMALMDDICRNDLELCTRFGPDQLFLLKVYQLLLQQQFVCAKTYQQGCIAEFCLKQTLSSVTMFASSLKGRLAKISSSFCVCLASSRLQGRPPACTCYAACLRELLASSPQVHIEQDHKEPLAMTAEGMVVGSTHTTPSEFPSSGLVATVEANAAPTQVAVAASTTSCPSFTRASISCALDDGTFRPSSALQESQQSLDAVAGEDPPLSASIPVIPEASSEQKRARRATGTAGEAFALQLMKRLAKCIFTVVSLNYPIELGLPFDLVLVPLQRRNGKPKPAGLFSGLGESFRPSTACPCGDYGCGGVDGERDDEDLFLQHEDLIRERVSKQLASSTDPLDDCVNDPLLKRCIFVEVKASKFSTGNFFNMSPNEVIAAHLLGIHYMVLIVENCGRMPPTVRYLMDPLVSQRNRGDVRLGIAVAREAGVSISQVPHDLYPLLETYVSASSPSGISRPLHTFAGPIEQPPPLQVPLDASEIVFSIGVRPDGSRDAKDV